MTRARLGEIAGYVVLAAFLVAALFSLIGPLQDSPGEANLYALQADAFLHGRLDLPQHFHDTAVFEGRFYVPFPPFPALLVTPIVALVGLHRTNMVLVSLLLAIGSVFVLASILRRLAVPRPDGHLAASRLFPGHCLLGQRPHEPWRLVHGPYRLGCLPVAGDQRDAGQTARPAGGATAGLFVPQPSVHPILCAPFGGAALVAQRASPAAATLATAALAGGGPGAVRRGLLVVQLGALWRPPGHRLQLSEVGGHAARALCATWAL